MVRKRLLFTFISAVFLSAVPSYSQTSDTDKHDLDAVTPGWLHIGGQLRGRWEGTAGSGFVKQSLNSYELNRVRLNLTVQPVKWLKFVGEMQDTHAFGYGGTPAATAQDPMDLRLGYVQLGGAEDRGAMLRVGRQEIMLGAGRLFSAVDWSNTGRSFDAARAAYRLPGMRFEVLAGSVVQPDGSRFDRHKPGEHFYASYNTFDRLIPGSVLEPYFIVKTVIGVSGETGSHGDADVYTAGVRWAGKVRSVIDYSAETAGQWGRWANDDIRAGAGTWTAGWTLSDASWKPRVSADYSLASGDHGPKDGRRSTFDMLYGANTPYLSLTGMIGWRNIRDVRAGFDFRPRKNLKVQLDYRDYWLASTQDGLYNSIGTLLFVNRRATSNHVGEGAEGQIIWTLPMSSQIAVGTGELFAGRYLQQSGRGSGYLYPYVMWMKRF